MPRKNIIGQEGMGFTMQMMQFQEERLYAAASSLKGFDRLIDLTIEYTGERGAFGKPVLDNQVVHFRLAELRTRGRGVAGAYLDGDRTVRRRRRRHAAGLDGEAEDRSAGARIDGRLPAILGWHGLFL